MIYPDNSPQRYIDDTTWWEKTEDKKLRPGRLLWAFVPHVDVIPKSMIPDGRPEDDPTNHDKARYRISDLRIKASIKKDSLPAAILPLYRNECYIVQRSKKRPVLLLGDGGPEIPKNMRSSMKPGWQTNPVITVAPYYGSRKKGCSKWYEPFVERIKRCEYPQYLWDILPINSETESSILRLDHIQPIGKHHDSYELTEYCLKEDAVDLMREWLDWLFTGEMDAEGILNIIQNELRDAGSFKR